MANWPCTNFLDTQGKHTLNSMWTEQIKIKPITVPHYWHISAHFGVTFTSQPYRSRLYTFILHTKARCQQVNLGLSASVSGISLLSSVICFYSIPHFPSFLSRPHIPLIPIPSPCFSSSLLLFPFNICYPMLSSHPSLSHHATFPLWSVCHLLLLESPLFCAPCSSFHSHPPGLSSTFPVILPQNTTSPFPWVVNNRSY